MVFIVFAQIGFFEIRLFLVEETCVKTVERAVVGATLFAKSAVFTEIQTERLGAAFALFAKPPHVHAAHPAMLALFFALRDVFEAIVADLAVTPAVFAHVALFAVIDLRADGAGMAL